eukprot:5893864-Pyramimonas_sp.AAC.1
MGEGEGTALTPPIILLLPLFLPILLQSCSKALLRSAVSHCCDPPLEVSELDNPDIPGMAKLLQSEFEVGFLVKRVATQTIELIRAEFSTWLQAVDRTTGENFKAALNEISYLPTIVGETFPRKIRLASTDDGSSNDRWFRDWERCNPKWSAFRTSCQVHKCANVSKRTVELTDASITGVLHCLLWLSHTGNMRGFRSTFYEVATEQLDIDYGPPPQPGTDMHEHQRSLFDNLLKVGSTSTFHDRWMRFVVESLLNGDWSIRGRVIHHCSGCCRDKAHAERKLRKNLGVLFSKLKVFSRSKWIDAEEVCGQICVLECVHKLFSTTFLRYASSHLKPDPKSEPQQDPSAMAIDDDAGEDDKAGRDEKEDQGDQGDQSKDKG